MIRSAEASRGFTLIELLIVVAIIAILAAIAVPNFLEAQTRAKVSRGKADMRSVATALETYMIDNNQYPFDIDSRGWPNYLTDVMTTPISYLTTANSLIDLFRMNQSNPFARRYRYINYRSSLLPPGWNPSPYPGPYFTRGGWCPTPSQSTYNTGVNRFGMWKLTSAGPDKTVNTSFFLEELYYDATNGTVSGGDIVLSSKGMK